MAESKRHVILIAGPNRAGKTTIAPKLLGRRLKVVEFVNADTISTGLSGFRPDSTAFEAGRIMRARLKILADRRSSFAFETTLASRTFAPWITRLCRAGYEFHLIFLWLQNPDQAVERVRDRVLMGGHNVPEDMIRRRYHAGLRNFFTLYQPLATSWEFYDNSSYQPVKLIAAGQGKTVETVHDPVTWDAVVKGTTREE